VLADSRRANRGVRRSLRQGSLVFRPMRTCRRRPRRARSAPPPKSGARMSNRIEYMGRYLTLALYRQIDSAAMTVPHSSLAGRRILITGGATGIGAAAVRVLHDAGARVVATYHRTAPTADVAPVTWLQCDVRDAEAVEATFRGAVAELGGLDVLVNAAGL